jgi:hypothetical protein
MAGDWVDIPDGGGEWVDVDPQAPQEANWRDKVAAVLHGARKGASLGFDDELGAATQALLQRVHPTTLNADGSEMSALDVYRQARGGNRAEEETIRKKAPNYYTGGEVGGGIAATIGTGAGLGAAAIYGGIQGLGDSNADLTALKSGDALDALKDAGIGAGVNVLGTGAGHAAGKLLPMALRATRTGLENLAIRTGRRVLNGGADLRNGLREVVSDDAVREALDAGAIRFGSTTEKAAQRLDTHSDALGKTYQGILDELEAKGVAGPEAKKIADQLLKRAAEDELASGADKSVARKFMREAQNAENIADPSGRIPLNRAEAIKRRLQSEAQSEYGKMGGSKPLGAAKKEVGSVYRQSIEDAVDDAAQGLPAGSDVRELADSFVPVKRRLAKSLEALEAAEKGANKAAGRNAIGLRETIVAGPQAASGDVLGAATTLGLTKAITTRGASTIAATANQGARLAKALAGAAAKRAGALTKAGAALGGSVARAANSQRMMPIIDVATGKQIGWYPADDSD